MSRSYLQLLQKFELALQLNEWEVLIPPLLPDEASFPQPDEFLQDVSMSECHDDLYQPPIRRFWVSNYIPEGFWPRLICRVYKDQQINSVLTRYVGLAVTRHFVEWKTWRRGMVFSSRGRTLVALKILDNSSESVAGADSGNTKFLTGKHRIEVHVFIPELIRIMQELSELRVTINHSPAADDSFVPFNVTADATVVMVAISNHIVSLSSWFIGMISGDSSGYTPCWKCFAGINAKDASSLKSVGPSGGFICSNEQLVYSLSVEKCIVPSCQGKGLRCPSHNELKAVHQTPDLVCFFVCLFCLP